MSDDDMPLTTLAKPKKSFGDNVPLAALAVPGGAKQARGRPSLGKPADKPKAAAGTPASKPQAKPKRKVEDSSSSDSSSSSSDSSSDSAGGKKKTAKTKNKIKLLNKKRGEDGDEEDNKVVKKSRTQKEQVAVELLCRWWYALPEWPPKDPAAIARKLEENNLRQVSIQEWEWVPELDEKGRRKVYELTQFKGVFRASDGTKFDLRPMDSCPSLNNMLRKDIAELYSLLVKAYENQLKDLENSKYDEREFRDRLNIALTKAREKSHNANQMTFNTGQKRNKLA